MLLGASLIIIIILMRILVGCFVPIGNENSTVRRLPWVTFVIMGVNVLVFFVTLPAVGVEKQELDRTGAALEIFVKSNSELVADEGVRNKLKEIGFLGKRELADIETKVKRDPDEYRLWLRGIDASRLREQFETLFTDYKAARESSLFYRYGLSPNGDWKVHQLITAAFIHDGIEHIFFNMVFFFAVAFSLEDIWGRSTFVAFYLGGAVISCLPVLISPIPVPGVGASGAISATMGAFLVRFPTTKLKLWFVPFSVPLLLFGRKPLTMMLWGYLYLVSYFVMNLLNWWSESLSGSMSGVGYSVHAAGFIFGLGFAGIIKLTKAEERYINPKIEAKVSFAASPVVTSALEMLDRGEAVIAERKLKAHVARNPDDADALLALIQVYQHTNSYDGLNSTYGQLIHHHLSRQDKEAALYAYDNLLSSFPDNEVKPRIPVRDWLTVCEYLLEAGMKREAAVEYERLVDAYPDDPLGVRACVQGGEAALAAHDNSRALRLFDRAQTMKPPPPLVARVDAGLEKVRVRLENRPQWLKSPQKTAPLGKDMDEQNVNY